MNEPTAPDMHAASAQTVMDLRVQLSSCVPSTDMETAGAEIGAEDLRGLMGHPSGIGLAEVMNYPGVIHRVPEMMAKLRLFEGGHMDGHCPQLSGRDLNAYCAAGIRTEHEATTEDEAREKLQRGMRVLIREGSVSKDLEALSGLLTEVTAPFMCLCTDDRNPLDIAEEGHLDHMIRALIARGASPLAPYRAASLSGAEAFGLRDRGLIAPGRRADIVAVGSLEACDARLVLCGASPIAVALADLAPRLGYRLAVAAPEAPEAASDAPPPPPVHMPTNDESEELLKIRHTTAHVMAMAVQKLWKDAKVTIGPWIEKGFYYDFDMPPLADKDLRRVKKEMDKIIQQKLPLLREEVSAEEAERRIREAEEPYKLEILEGIRERDPDAPITLYHMGGMPGTPQHRWWDLCAGPHVEHTGMLPKDAIALESIAGAYWRGDESRPMLQRIYGTAWQTAEQLAEHQRLVEEAKR